jgi:hypothetical protein
LILAALLLLAASPPRPFSEERALLDRRLEMLRRLLPDAGNPAADVAALREIVDSIKLQGFDAVARPPTEAGGVGFVTLDVGASGRFADVDRLFRLLALQQRPIDVESLSLRATPEGLVRLQTVLRYPFRPKTAPLPAPPQGPRPPSSGVSRPQAESYLRDQALALSKSEALAALRRARRNPRLFLSELAAVTRERPVILTEAQLGEEFQVRGLVIGEAPSRELEARFERGFFRISDFLMARQGACRRFEARGKSPIAGTDAELAIPAEDPFRPDDAPCRVDRDAAHAPPLQVGAAGRADKSREAGLTLRLRDVDLADLFYALHMLTGRGFLVDGDVLGRVNVEVQGASLDDVLQAVHKNGLRLRETDTLVRVSAAASAPPRPPLVGPPFVPEGETSPAKRASFSLKREGAREVLAVMTDVDPSLAALGPQGFLGRLSLWIRDAPLPDVRTALLESVGLTELFEEGRRVVRRLGRPEDALFPVAGAPPLRKLALRPRDIDVSDFELAGVALSGAQTIAFAYGPSGTLYAYRPGDRLADAALRAVNSTDVELATDEGPLRVALPMMR